MGNIVQNWLAEISSDQVQNYLKEHETEDHARLMALKNKPIFSIPASVIADQILARVRAKLKIPEFYSHKGIVFPDVVNLEQCSSEVLANYKMRFLQNEVANTNVLIDLTGGFGIDSKFFCHIFDQVISVDPDKNLNEITRWNFKILQVFNFKRLDLTAEAFLAQNPKSVSCFYADPSRRRDQKRVISLKNCLPDITSLQRRIFQQSRFLLIKASPLLDVSLGLSELNHVRKVIVVSVSNECKEILFFCDRDSVSIPTIEAVNVKGSNQEEFSFTQAEEALAKAPLGGIDRYLYEPNSSILKAGAFKLVGARFSLSKLDKNSHFYTSPEFRADFPGRIFEVVKTLKSNPSEIRAAFPEQKANIISRNYPLTVAEIKKKLRLTEGGEKFLIATSTETKKLLIVADRLK